MIGAYRPPIFLKLGGSLITHKGQDFTPRTDLLDQVCGVIAQFIVNHPDTRLVLGMDRGLLGTSPRKIWNTGRGAYPD